jgi:Ca2+/Na+ antiporter
MYLGGGCMIERSEKGERKFDILFMVTFIIFFLELLYLNSPKVELTDWLVVGLLFVLLYFFRKKEDWIIRHQEAIRIFGLMMLAILTIRILKT